MCESISYPNSCFECARRLHGGPYTEHFKAPNGLCEAWCESCIVDLEKSNILADW